MTPQPIVCGVYMLFKAHALIYVGRSRDCYRRIADHRQNGREFDYATVTGCPEADVAWIEQALIKAMEPVQNRSGKAPALAALSPILRPLPPRPGHPLDTISIAEARAEAGKRSLTRAFNAAIASGAIPTAEKHPGSASRARVVLRKDYDAWCEARQAERFSQAS